MGLGAFPLAAVLGDARMAGMGLNLDAPSAGLGRAGDAWVALGEVRRAARAKRPAAGLDFPKVAARDFPLAVAARELPVVRACLIAAGRPLGRPQQAVPQTAVWWVELMELQGELPALQAEGQVTQGEWA